MLTDKQCKNAVCPPDKAKIKLSDGGGLYLEVAPTGAKRWFYRYRKPGMGDKAGAVVESRISLGVYPVITVAQARKARDDAKAKRSGGIDPVQARKLEKLQAKALRGETFADVGREYIELRTPEWSDRHKDRSIAILERDLLPKLGPRIMRDITTPELIMVLKAIEKRGTLQVLEKARALCTGLWGFALTAGKVQSNIAMGLRNVFKKAPERHYPAITDPARFGVLLRHIQAYEGGPVVKAALQLSPLLFQRPGEIRGMAWGELDLDNALWTIPPGRMKRTKDGKTNGDPHLVPLSRQAVQILRELHPYTGQGSKVFPGERDHDRPMSDAAIRVALQTMGFSKDEHTAHGFRASARTMLDEELGFDPLVIEAQLAHGVRDSLGRAYNRTKHIKQRTTMMQAWADYCDLLTQEKVIVLPKAKVRA